MFTRYLFPFSRSDRDVVYIKAQLQSLGSVYISAPPCPTFSSLDPLCRPPERAIALYAGCIPRQASFGRCQRKLSQGYVLGSLIPVIKGYLRIGIYCIHRCQNSHRIHRFTCQLCAAHSIVRASSCNPDRSYGFEASRLREIQQDTAPRIFRG
jgi:hypothetical protein